MATTEPVKDTRASTSIASKPEATGLRAGLTNYGDDGFALFLRKAFIKGAGYSDDALDRTIIGVIDTGVSLQGC